MKGKIINAQGFSTLLFVPKSVDDFGNYTCQNVGTMQSYQFTVKEICKFIFWLKLIVGLRSSV